jgi:hypothetical protein
MITVHFYDKKMNTLLLMSSYNGVASRSNFIFYLIIDLHKAFHSAMEYDWALNAKEPSNDFAPVV